VRERRRHRQLTATGAVILAVGACSGGGGDSGDGGDYGPAERADFVEACSAEGRVTTAVCGCFYDRLAETLSHDRFEELDERLRDDPVSVPAEVADLAIACSAAQSGSASD
jgi:hypothetical protein